MAETYQKIEQERDKLRREFAALCSRVARLEEAVKRLRKIEGNKPLHPVQDGLLIDARAEVEHLLNPPLPGDNGYGVVTEHDLD